MKVTIKVTQKIVNGELHPKKYSLYVVIPYGTGDIHWEKDMSINDLDEDTIRELIPRLTAELERALAITSSS